MCSLGDPMLSEWVNYTWTFWDIVLIVAGVLLCLEGWTFYWLGIHAVGFVAGAAAAAALSGVAVKLGVPGAAEHWPVVVAAASLLLGLIGAFAARPIHYLLSLLFGAAAGVLVWRLFTGGVVMDFWSGLSETGAARTVVAALGNAQLADALAAGVGAVLGLLCARYMVVMATAVLGSYMFAKGLFYLSDTAFVTVFATGALVGAVLQLAAIKRARIDVRGGEAPGRQRVSKAAEEEE